MPILKQAIADNTVVVIDCPVDYSENMKLTRAAEQDGLPGVRVSPIMWTRVCVWPVEPWTARSGPLSQSGARRLAAVTEHFP